MKEVLSNYYQPLIFPCEWRKLLAEPIEHWKDGKSAKELVKLWTQSDELPQTVRDLFPDDEMKAIFLFPEYSVPMPGKGKDSFNDLYVLTSTKNGYLPIIVEAKAGESFGERIYKWYNGKNQNNSDKGKNAEVRINGILDIFKLTDLHYPANDRIANLRYQLFHRTASAVLEAQRIRSNKALVLIISFKDTKRDYQDFVDFLELFSINNSEKNALLGPYQIDQVDLYFSWIDCNI